MVFSLEKDADGYYLIENTSDFLTFCTSVNEGTSMNGRLTADIDLSTVCGEKQNWTPINPLKKSIRFDGGNHTISHLYIDTNEANQALFYCADIIQNLIVKDFYVRGGDNTSALLVLGSGSNGKMLINNCHVVGDVIGAENVGGICAGIEMKSANIVNCSNSALVVGTNAVGGLTGCANECRFDNCYNVGRVKSYYRYEGNELTQKGIVAGFVGHTSGCEFTNCYSYGKISGLAKGCFVGERGGRVNVGLTSCFSLEDLAQVHSYESAVAFWGKNKFKDGTLLNSLNGFLKNTQSSVMVSNFNLMIMYLTWEQKQNEDEYPHIANNYYTPTEDFVINYRGDYFSIEIFKKSMTLPVCDEKSFRYIFSDQFDGKNVVSDTVVVVTKIINDELIDKDEEGFYLIRNAQQLSLFRDAVNGGATGISARLMNNINMSDECQDGKWPSIGGSDLCCGTPFNGVFDGNGYTIKGLNQQDGYAFAGLFSRANGATIKNLMVEDSYMEGCFVGSICAYAESSLIYNCGSSAQVVGTCHEGAAGFVGVAVDGTILNCYNTGSVKGEGKVAGFVGALKPTSIVENCFASCEVAKSGNHSLISPFVFENAEVGVSHCYYDSVRYVRSSGDTDLSLLNIFVTAKSEREMKSLEFVDTLNAQIPRLEELYPQTELYSWSATNNGCPILSMFTVGLGKNPSNIKSKTINAYGIEGVLHIESEQAGDVTILNAMGQIVKKTHIQPGETKIYDLDKGIYFIQNNKVILR